MTLPTPRRSHVRLRPTGCGSQIFHGGKSMAAKLTICALSGSLCPPRRRARPDHDVPGPWDHTRWLLAIIELLNGQDSNLPPLR